MDYKKLALVPAVGLAMLACGESTTPPEDSLVFPDRDAVCASGAATPCMTTAPGATMEQRTVPKPEETEPMTMTFVISTLSIPEANSAGDAAGFNLDALDSGTGVSDPSADCQSRIADFTGLYDENLIGVDNALQTLVPIVEGFLDEDTCGGDTAGCLDRLISGQIADGTILLMAEVGGVNSLSYDTEVTLSLFLGAVPEGSTLEIDGSGAVAPGQTFDTSLVITPTPVAGDIFNGRLRAHAPMLPIMIDVGDFMLPLVISNAEVRFDITATGLNRGVIGGSLQNADIVEAASEFAPDMVGVIMGFLMTISDITPSAADARNCEALSVGLTFGATTATRNPPG